MGNQRFSITPAAAAIDLNITDSIFRTLAVIGIYGDENGWCWPSQKTLADHRGVSRQTINTHIKILTDRGYLNIQPRYDGETGAQKSNMMQVKLDRDYKHFTPPVKSRTLHPPSNNELYTPHQILDLTHNDPINDPIEQKIYIDGGYDGNGKYIHPDPEPIAEIKTAVSLVTKTPFWGETEELYDKSAYMLHGWDATPEQIKAFGEWWKKNGNYKGKPALKSVMNEWQNFIQSVKPSSNGKSPQFAPVEINGEIFMQRIES